MQEKNDFQTLNADDRRLIAKATSKSKNLVDKVLRGERRNKSIVSIAVQLLEEKQKLMEVILKSTESE